MKSPVWSPLLKQGDVRRLYEQDAAGLISDDLLERVGIGLLARCQDLLTAHEAVRGNASCPACQANIVHDRNPKSSIACEACGWSGRWGAYLGSLKGMRMAAGTLHPVIESFVKAYPTCTSDREKMVAIDQILHRFHHELEGRTGNAFAWNLIEGSETEVIAFLRELTYGDKSAPATVANRDRYLSLLDETEAQNEEHRRQTQAQRLENRKGKKAERAAVETHGPATPKWEPKLSQRLIARLYDEDAKGLRDEAVVDEVGIRLMARVGSMMVVTRAVGGDVKCPMCPNTIKRKCVPEEVLRCPCGWIGTWENFRKAYKKESLLAVGMMPYLEAFVEEFPLAKGYSQKMILVDQLIHRYHGELMDPGGARAGCANLIEGKVREVIKFLNALTYTQDSTGGLAEVRVVWKGRREARK
jgi:ribosomal protein L37AE/L43A